MYLPQVRSLRNDRAEGRSLRAPLEHHQREDLHRSLVLARHRGMHHRSLPALQARSPPRAPEQGCPHHRQGKLGVILFDNLGRLFTELF